jgi:prophage regulatory protein
MATGAKKRGRPRNNGGSSEDGQDPLLAKLIELHGRTTEVARRVLDDARILADLQRDTSALLGELWSRRPEPSPTPPVSRVSFPPPAPQPRTEADPRSPRFLRFKDVARRVGLSRSSVWRMEREGRFPQHHKLSANSVGWWEPDVEEWLRSRRGP